MRFLLYTVGGETQPSAAPSKQMMDDLAKLTEETPDDRAEAIRRMRRALDMFIVEGVRTSIPLHQEIFAHPDFQRGDIYTAFLEHMNDPPKDRGIA